jgi:hypothetical protein
MTNSVPPLPDGVGILAVGDRRRERNPQGGRFVPTDEGHPVNGTPRSQPAGGHAGDTPSPAPDDSPVEAETLFATALFANALLRLAPSATELKLRTSQGWQPPESVLRLKDKTI